MSAQAAVLQLVILRDGLLVGTEVLVPGSYVLGSSAESDVRLDDGSIAPQHAVLYFQNGRIAIQDSGSPMGVYVNGHRVKQCEIRSQDEVLCGPFALKARLLNKQPQKGGPPPEVAALLQGTPAPAKVSVAAQAAGTVASRVPAVHTHPTVNVSTPAKPPPPVRDGPQTVLSTRKRAESGRIGELGNSAEMPTEAVLLPHGFAETVPRAKRSDPPTVHVTLEEPLPPGAEEVTHAEETTHAAGPTPTAPKAKAKAKAPKKVRAPSFGASTGKGKARVYFELYWGETRQVARSFRPDKKHPVVADELESAALPLWGFRLPEGGFTIAEEGNGNSFRVFMPPGAVMEKKKGSGFEPATGSDLQGGGSRRYLNLANGDAVRFSQGQMSLVAYVAPPPEKVFVNPLKGLPWLALSLWLMGCGGFGYFLIYGPKPPEVPDFTARNVAPVAVRLIRPEPKKKEEAKKMVEAIKAKAEKVQKAEKREKPQIAAKEKTPPPKSPVAPESKALKALAKLSAAGPAMGSMLAAIDKMGNGPGSKHAKNDFKLSGIIGKGPLANAGTGTFGFGGGGRGGIGTLGAETLRGPGGGGIGLLGGGGVGKGRIGGTVTRASARSVTVSGSIDREAVAKVVNSHLQEVRACYERTLLKDPGLAGKVVLEWTIGAAGRVVSAKTKNSTLHNGEVESCILQNLKNWQFPLPRGGSVIISYPFLFNSVGY